MARVVVRDCVIEFGAREVEFSIIREVLDDLRVVVDVDRAIGVPLDAVEFGILVLERVVAVGVRTDQRLELAVFEGSGVVLGEHLVEPLFADSSDVVAVVLLVVVEDPVVDARVLEDRRHRARDAPVALVVARIVADVPEVFDRAIARVGHVEIELLDPVGALALRLAERVALLEDVHHRLLDVVVHLAHLGQPAVHLGELRDVLDIDGAGVHTGHAGHAGLHRARIDDARAAVGDDLLGLAAGVHRLAVLLEIEDHVPGIERSARRLGGADRRTASALGTGVLVEHLFPGHVLDLGEADLVGRGVGRYAGQADASLLVARDDVGETRQHVERFGVGDGGDEPERQEGM